MTLDAFFAKMAGVAKTGTPKPECQIQFNKHNREDAPPPASSTETFSNCLTYTPESVEFVTVGPRPFGIAELKVSVAQLAGTLHYSGPGSPPPMKFAVHDGPSGLFVAPLSPISRGAQIQYKGETYPYDNASIKDLKSSDPNQCKFMLGSDCTVTLTGD